MVVIVRENQSAPVVALHGCVPAGSLHEAPHQAGLASFVASLLSRGSQRYDFATFNETVESLGGSLTFSADTHSTDFNLNCLAEDFATLVPLLGDALCAPTFPEEHVARVRQQKLVFLQERDQDTTNVANLRCFEALFGRDHPYGWAMGGYLDTVAALRRDDLASFHAHRYTPAGAIVVVAGAVTAQAVVDLLDLHLGGWRGPQPERTTPSFPTVPQGARITAAMPGKIQSDIVIGARGVARSDPDYYTVRVANCILGQFGLMGRLGERVREEQGLAYYAYSSTMADLAGGAWTAAAGVNPAHVEQAVASILDECAEMGVNGATDEELADSQSYLTGVVPLTLETNDGVVSTLLNMEWHGLGLDYLLRYRDLINGVTAADVQRVMAKYLNPEKCTVVVAGPDSDEE